MKYGYLAPTTSQRLKYIDWLHVYGKDRSRIPVRMASLVDDYVSQIEQLLSMGEWPTLVSAALSFPHNLGHLIYGAEIWAELGGIVSDGHDQLTEFFRETELIGHYVPLFLEQSDICSQSLPRCTTYTYTYNKQIWSIAPFPTNFQGRAIIDDSASPYRVEGEERRRMLFSYIVEKTRKVAIGPLEYCGNAHLVHIGTSDVVAPCYGDPTLTEYYALRDIKKRCLPPPSHGAQRAGMGASELKEFELHRVRDKENEDENILPEAAPPKPKKKRLSEDQRLAAAGSQILRPIN
ncbi:hypothetical protein DFH07DRAFT_765177 [Mycena maculata]|uniref:Uncharacterized protein n=1 Tax=Mycena maculata TaxID=230809 RepID=A0AAD7KAR6_9AGAR|nr:hypothetical protein DFH07DRAFT_765177 [Mycena maculata]